VCTDVGKTRRLRSPIIQNSHNPVWNQKAIVYVADEAEDITVEIKVRHKAHNITVLDWVQTE
jgi:hypothetical protein